MAKMKELLMDIEDMLMEEMSVEAIAAKTEMPVEWIMEIKQSFILDSMDSINDSMDGDAESAFTSAGWGVDESYIMDNDYFD